MQGVVFQVGSDSSCLLASIVSLEKSAKYPIVVGSSGLGGVAEGRKVAPTSG